MLKIDPKSLTGIDRIAYAIYGELVVQNNIDFEALSIGQSEKMAKALNGDNPEYAGGIDRRMVRFCDILDLIRHQTGGE